MSPNNKNSFIEQINLIKLVISILLLITSYSVSILQAYNLPDIGSTTELTLSYQDEKLIGEYIYKDLLKQLPITPNPFIADYIQTLGNKLLKNSDSHYSQFNFFVVDSPIINAFALPGGYIAINKGLITAADDESEVASVIAHEISHVTQRHIARSFEKQAQVQLPMIAGMVVGALLAAYSPELAQSVIAGTMAMGNQALLNYSRSNESEADRIGMGILVKSGYSAYSMADFFNKLQKHAYADKDFFPEYLRTHPVNETRIADARNRADKIQQNKAVKNNNIVNSLDFYLIRNILQINSEQNLIKVIDNNLTAGKQQNLSEDEQNLYQFNAAFALLKNQEFKKARPILEQLQHDYPQNNIIASLLAESYADDHNKALQILESQLNTEPNNIPLSIQYTKTAMLLKQYQKAIDKLKSITKSHSDYNPQIDLLLAENYHQLGNKWHANLAYAEYSIKKGDLQAALMQLRATAKFEKLNNYQTKIVNFKIKDLENKYKFRQEKLKQWL
jgi:predicted Zn-dependent protease